MAFDRAGAKAAGYSDAEIDAYLAEKEKAARPALSSMDRPEESFLRSAGRAIESGALLGWADEAVGGIGAGIELARTGSISDALRAYRDITDHEREAAANFSASNPKSDLALQLGGGILSLAATPARALAGAGKTYGQLAAGGARVGALAGLGSSEKSSFGEAVKDTAIGAGFGAALSVAVPFALQQGANAVTGAGRWLGNKAEQIGGRLGALAGGEPVTGVLRARPGPSPIEQQAEAYIGALQQGMPEVTGTVGRLVDRADDLGIKLTPGTRYQNDTLRRMEAGLSSNAMTAGPFDDIVRANKGRFTEEMAVKMGLPPGTREVSPEMLGAAVDSIKSGLDDIGNQIGRVRLDKQARSELKTLMTQATDHIAPEPELAGLIRRLQKAHDFGAGTTGRRLMELRSALLKKSQSAWRTGDTAYAQGIDGVIDVLDGVAERSAGPELGAQWAKLRSQWKWVKAFEKGNTFNEATGTVNIGNLRSQLRRDPAYLRGRDIVDGVGDPLLDMARISLLSKQIVNDSGTATRQGALQQFVRHPVESTFTFASKPFVGAYVDSGPLAAPVLGSLLSGPQQTARAAQLGVLSESARRGRDEEPGEDKRRRRRNQ